MTADRNYRATSERVAGYFLGQLPADSVPPWDFAARGPDEPKDSLPAPSQATVSSSSTASPEIGAISKRRRVFCTPWP